MITAKAPEKRLEVTPQSKPTAARSDPSPAKAAAKPASPKPGPQAPASQPPSGPKPAPQKTSPPKTAPQPAAAQKPALQKPAAQKAASPAPQAPRNPALPKAMPLTPADKPRPAPALPGAADDLLLAPLDDGLSGSIPVAQTADPYDGLMPLNDPLAGLTPLPEAPFALEDPFLESPGGGFASGPLAGTYQPLPGYAPPGGLPANPFADASQATNPYAPSISPAAVYQPPIDDRGRRGLPWERDPSMGTFWETTQLVLASPSEAFSRMRRGGGFGNPMGFLTAGTVLGQVTQTLYIALGSTIYLFLLRPQPEIIIGSVVIWSLRVLGQLAQSLFAGLAGGFLAAGLWHGCCRLFGAGRGGYQGTYRALAFVQGSTQALGVVPIIGPLVALVYFFVLMIHAVVHTHEVSGVRAAAAVCIPALLTCGATILLFYLTYQTLNFHPMPPTPRHRL
jgi:hypothetical protein